jgi:hypothetical protein
MPLTTAANIRALRRKVEQPLGYASLRWNDGEFHNIFLGKTPLRTFLYTNMLLEVWAIPALALNRLTSSIRTILRSQNGSMNMGQSGNNWTLSSRTHTLAFSGRLTNETNLKQTNIATS